MSPNPEPVASLVALKSVASGVGHRPAPAVEPDGGSEWRSLSGVALAILADLERRRREPAATGQSVPQPKAA